LAIAIRAELEVIAEEFDRFVSCGSNAGIDYNVVSAQVGTEQLLYGSLVDVERGGQLNLHIADLGGGSWWRLRSGQRRTCQNLRYENGSADHVSIISLYAMLYNGYNDAQESHSYWK